MSSYIPECDTFLRCFYGISSRDFRRFFLDHLNLSSRPMTQLLKLLVNEKKLPHFVGIPQHILMYDYPFTWEEFKYYITNLICTPHSYFRNKNIFPTIRSVVEKIPEIFNHYESRRLDEEELFKEIAELYKTRVPFNEYQEQYTKEFQLSLSLEYLEKNPRDWNLHALLEDPRVDLAFIEKYESVFRQDDIGLYDWHGVTIKMVLENKFDLQEYCKLLTKNESISLEDILAHPELDWCYQYLTERKDVLPHFIRDNFPHVNLNEIVIGRMEGIYYKYLKEHPEFDYSTLVERTFMTYGQMQLNEKFISIKWKISKITKLEF